jgi:hypothetical protein
MKHWTRWLAMGVAVTLLLVAADATEAGGLSGPTVGQFVTQVASQSAGTPVTLDQAIKAMRRLGIVIKDPNAQLTQDMLSRILRVFGFRSETGAPGALADFGAANGALSLLTTGFLGGGSPGSGTFSRPLDVGVCLDAPSQGACVSCCVHQGSGPGSSGGLPAPICVQFCQFLASPSMAGPRSR